MTEVFMFVPSCIPPVLRWLRAHQDQLNSSAPWSSRSEPAYSRGCASWVPLIGTHNCGGRCCRSGGTAGRGEGRRGYSSWKERHPTGNGRPRYSGYDWRQEEGENRLENNRNGRRVREETKKWRKEEKVEGTFISWEVKHRKYSIQAQYTLNISEKWAVPPQKCHHVITFLFTHSFSLISSLTNLSLLPSWPTFPSISVIPFKSKGQIYF